MSKKNETKENNDAGISAGGLLVDSAALIKSNLLKTPGVQRVEVDETRPGQFEVKVSIDRRTLVDEEDIGICCDLSVGKDERVWCLHKFYI